ncbi:MAG: cardiolipin synthase, partial [Sinomicrobium sp.]|nr:cardiolipin synthase [Sinomicrobium sp.]
GMQLVALLCEKALQGVAVRLSYDYVGSSLSKSTRRMLRESGVECYPFMPVYFPRFTCKLNYRNHRKIAVIDGKTGYVGGINIAERYINKDNELFWRDTHLRIEGEAVGSLQLHFMLNWDFLTDYDVIIEDHFFPETTVTDTVAVQIAAAGPDTDWANIMEAVFTAINTAENYICITTPYFIPNNEIVTALTAAAKSGIDIKLIIPDISDSWAAKYATFSFVAVLLKAGVKVYRYKKGFIHAKVMIVDDIFTTIGTSNMDYRSFDINFEINALIYDREVAAVTLRSFKEDLKHSERILSEAWEQRKFTQKLKESFCRLWAPLL